MTRKGEPKLALCEGNIDCAKKYELPPRGVHGKRLLEPELQQSLTRDLYLLAARHHLNGSSCSGTDTRADRRAFAAPGDCTDNRAESRAAAYFLSGVLAASLALQRVIAADDRVVLAVDHHPREFQL